MAQDGVNRQQQDVIDYRCLRCLLLVMCTYPFAKKALTLYLARGEGRELYFGCNLMQRKVLASSHQHLMAEAPLRLTDDERRRLAVKGKALGRKLLAEVAGIVTPETLLAWHRRCCTALAESEIRLWWWPRYVRA